jgi:hypothetical protein
MPTTFDKLNLKDHKEILVLNAPDTFEKEIRLHGGEGEAYVNDYSPAEFRNDKCCVVRLIPGRSITGKSGNMLTTSGINGPFGPRPRRLPRALPELLRR